MSFSHLAKAASHASSSANRLARSQVSAGLIRLRRGSDFTRGISWQGQLGTAPVAAATGEALSVARPAIVLDAGQTCKSWFRSIEGANQFGNPARRLPSGGIDDCTGPSREVIFGIGEQIKVLANRDHLRRSPAS